MLARRRDDRPPTPELERPDAGLGGHGASLEGEADARRVRFALLVRQCEGALLRIGRRMCGGDPERAQDLVQEAFVRGYEAYLRGGYQDGTNARAWFCRILTTVFLNDYRQRRRRGVSLDVEDVTRGGTTGPEALRASSADRPDLALLSATLDERLEAALASLSPEYRLCVILVDIEGLDYAAAAAALNVPLGTVRSRLSRARLQLQSRLQDYAREYRHAAPA